MVVIKNVRLLVHNIYKLVVKSEKKEKKKKKQKKKEKKGERGRETVLVLF